MIRLFVKLGFVSFSIMIAVTASAQQLSREEKVLHDRRQVEADGFWIYNDLEAGFEEARRSGKPLLVVLRCIPCEECVKLDDELMDNDPELRPLLEKFVCVRQISANGLDLNIFQFDTDQSFAAFMLNGDGTIYGRFGTRSHRTDWVDDVSLEGMAEALRGALAVHAGYPANRIDLAGKRGKTPAVARPELYPTLKDRYGERLPRSGNVVASCIHCHQIGDARLDGFRLRSEPIPDEFLFPYPHPTVLGLKLDPNRRAAVLEVAADSIADRAGLRPGDEILRINRQPILSIADVQWVLNQVPASGGEIVFTARNGDEHRVGRMSLPADWRQAGDISWRVSTWTLRRMAAGGMTLQPLDSQARDEFELGPDTMALLVKAVGKWGPHAAAMRNGFQPDDVIIAVDDRTDLMHEADFLRYGVQQRKPGERVQVQLLRDGNTMTLALPMQR